MNHLNRIVCINLKERKDKYANVKKVFDKLKINVEFYFAEKHATSGRIGCFESHINVIKQSYNNNDKIILIFEDDVINTPSYDENNIQFVIDFMNKNEWCEYLQLGYSILPHEMYSYLKSNKLTANAKNSIIQYNGNTTHAYILNRSGMKRILQNWEDSVYNKKLDLDIYYKDIFKNNGASICPILFDQNFCIDNDNDKATTLYYKAMRNISCFQYNYSFLYYFSLLKFYLFFLLLSFCLIIVIIVLYFYRNNIMILFKRKKIIIHK
jgi:GR25 family glycosyltransferase involved in LPS biosynthesis